MTRCVTDGVVTGSMLSAAVDAYDAVTTYSICDHKAMIAALEAALRSQVKVEGWRPIDTAPMDRTMLLLADKSGSVQIGFWNGSAWDDGDFHDNMGPMTHWRHIPSAPTKRPNRHHRRGGLR